MINIITDSCSDLTPELITKYRLTIVPLNVFIDNQTYQDGLNITNKELFRLVEKTGILPKTSAPSVAEFTKVFSDLPGDHLYIGIGSKLSATLQSAHLAAQEVNHRQIRLVDSTNLSTGIGLLVLKAAELRDQGVGLDEIEKEILAMVPKLRTSFVVDTLDYLYKGGRCSALQNIVGGLLKIRPIIEVRSDGTLGIKDKSRGTRKKALDYLCEQFQKNVDKINLERVFVTHTACEEDAQYVKETLLKSAPIREVLITEAGATVSSHCGPNTIGLIYILA